MCPDKKICISKCHPCTVNNITQRSLSCCLQFNSHWLFSLFNSLDTVSGAIFILQQHTNRGHRDNYLQQNTRKKFDDQCEQQSIHSIHPPISLSLWKCLRVSGLNSEVTTYLWKAQWPPLASEIGAVNKRHKSPPGRNTRR